MQSAEHPFELPQRDFMVLNLDWKQQGVGGDNSWGDWPHEQYLIPCQAQRYSFRLRPFSASGMTDRSVARAAGQLARQTSNASRDGSRSGELEAALAPEQGRTSYLSAEWAALPSAAMVMKSPESAHAA